MTKEIVTVDLILETLQKWVEERQPIDASTWLDASAKLTLLSEDVQNELFETEQVLSKERVILIEGGDSVTKAEVKIKARDEYVKTKKLEAKIDRITELVRISKLQARMSSDA